MSTRTVLYVIRIYTSSIYKIIKIESGLKTTREILIIHYSNLIMSDKNLELEVRTIDDFEPLCISDPLTIKNGCIGEKDGTVYWSSVYIMDISRYFT